MASFRQMAVLVVTVLVATFSAAPASQAMDEATCSAYASSAVDQSTIYFANTCSGGLAEWWKEDHGYHKGWCLGLPQDSPLPAKGQADRDAVLAQCEGADAPRILTGEQQIARCAGLQGDALDQCMVRTVISQEDPSLCNALPGSRCADIVGVALVRRCAELPDAERAQCELEVAESTGSIEACAGSIDPDACITTASAFHGNLQAILDKIGDPRVRDEALMIYANHQRDAAAIEHISDPHLHDQALIYIAGSIGVGEDRMLDPNYCDRLRGSYGEAYDDEELERMRRQCLGAVAISNLSTTLKHQTELAVEREMAAAAIRRLSESLSTGKISIEQIIEAAGMTLD